MLAPSTVVLEASTEGESIGLIYFADIRPLHHATGHYHFWDRNPGRGRHRVLLSAQRHVMRMLGLHRMQMSVPIYAFSALRRMHHIGYRLEGRRREAILNDGKRADLLDFGVLLAEITDDTLEAAKLPNDETASWNTILHDNAKMMHYILRGSNGHDNARRESGVQAQHGAHATAETGYAAAVPAVAGHDGG